MDTAALCKTALFRGSSPEEVEAMLACLGAERRQYAKGEMVCRVGDVISSMGVVLRGSLDLPVRYPPYGEKLDLLKLLLR